MPITVVLLGLAIAAVWLPSLRLGPRIAIAPWAVLHIAAVLAGLASGLLDWRAALALAVMAGLCLVARSNAAQRTSGGAWTLAAGTGSLALALHALPGFHNPLLLDEAHTSALAAPFTLYASLDKASAGLYLLVFLVPRLRAWSDVRAIAGPTVVAATVAAVLTLGAACAIGLVLPDPKVPGFAPLFLAVNLLFTCVAEEVFFRGLIQERLSRAQLLGRHQPWLAIGASTLLFTLAHTGPDPRYLALVGLAGLAYSLVYARTRRIEAAVLTHFAVNAAHFFLFTYPARAM